MVLITAIGLKLDKTDVKTGEEKGQTMCRYLDSVQQMVSGEFGRGLSPDTVC